MILSKVEMDRKAVLVAKQSNNTITEPEKVELKALVDKEAK